MYNKQYAIKKNSIFFKSIIRIFIKLRISTPLSNKDYLFKFNYAKVYAHIININIFFIYIKNDIDFIKIVFRCFNLNIIIEYNVDLCLAIYLNNHNLIMKNRELRINKLKNNFNIKINNNILMCDNEK